mmetsp:Transcript_44129/g.53003  ORF Transcript_44129/g.53003 Transcript_44129/m.53003 type:complete len:82 (-) Transcript_44129:241-486(-)
MSCSINFILVCLRAILQTAEAATVKHSKFLLVRQCGLKKSELSSAGNIVLASTMISQRKKIRSCPVKTCIRSLSVRPANVD